MSEEEGKRAIDWRELQRQELQRRQEAFMAEYRALVQKHGLDFAPFATLTPDGRIVAQIRLVEVQQ